MAQQTIGIGSAPDDGTGDPARTAFDKVNDNFDECYAARDADALYGYDFGITPSVSADRTSELEAAFAEAASSRKRLILPAGAIHYTGPISVPSNCHVVGAGIGQFGTTLIADDTEGFIFGDGTTFVFKGGFENLMLQQVGTAADYVLKVYKAYSLVFRNVEIYQINTSSAAVNDALVIVDGVNNDILFDKLIIQHPTPQPPIGVRLANGCGSIRFREPDVEGCAVNIKWEGGKIELHNPYMEASGAQSIEHKPNAADTTASFKCFGGFIQPAASSNGLAFRTGAHDVDYYGTKVAGSTSNDVYFYDPTTVARINFWGCAIDYTKINGATTPWGSVGIYGRRLLGSKTHNWGSIAAGASESTTVTVTGAKLGYHTARASMSISQGGLMLYADVSADDTVRVTAFNPTGSAIDLASATLYAFADSAPIR